MNRKEEPNYQAAQRALFTFKDMNFKVEQNWAGYQLFCSHVHLQLCGGGGRVG